MITNNKALEPQPLVSIGLPVYNGENYLRNAVETILGQTYDNIELLISDNASTDATGKICRDMAARDPRVRVSRNERNIGAARNYNYVFSLARGKYFKWAAHDDLLAPTFVESAVRILESSPDVVLCSAITRRIDHAGHITGTYASYRAWDGPSSSGRFRSLVLAPHACVAVFGLMRSEHLALTRLIGPYVNSDRVLVAELGLRGRIHEIPEDLFFRRDHPGSSLRSFPDPRTRVTWFDPSKSASFAFSEWNTVLGYAGAVSRARLSPLDRAKCWAIIARLSLTQWRPLLADFKHAALGLRQGWSSVKQVGR